jgi:hypothetical protein
MNRVKKTKQNEIEFVYLSLKETARLFSAQLTHDSDHMPVNRNWTFKKYWVRDKLRGRNHEKLY